MSVREKALQLKQDIDGAYTAGYGKGENAGYDAGYDAGYEAGKAEGSGDSYYDEFWDAYQQNGNRTGYSQLFAGSGWNDDTLKPKYTIAPANGNQIFYYSKITSLKKLVEAGQVAFDFSKLTNGSSMFSYATELTDMVEIDLTKSYTMYGLFNGCSKLVTVDKVKLPQDNPNSSAYNSAFSQCKVLQNILFEGSFIMSISFQYSPLSVDSMKNIISCLENYAGTSNELKYTVKFTDDCWTALEADSTSPNGNTWKEYVGDLGWLT